MNQVKKHRNDFLIVAGLIILPLLLFAPVTLGNQTMLPADNLYQWAPWSAHAEEIGIQYPHNGLLSDLILENLAWKEFVRESIQSREIPLWNPYVFAGSPFLATGQHSTYYPFGLLYLIVSLPKAYGWYTIIQLWMAGAFMYVLGRVLGMRRASAGIAGLMYQGSGFLVVSSAVFPMILGAAIWLPLLLACLEKIVQNTTRPDGSGSTLPWAVIGAISLGMQVLAGHIEITYYTLLVMGLFATWRILSSYLEIRRNNRRDLSITNLKIHSNDNQQGYLIILRPLLWSASFVIIGLMLGAIQFIPFLEVGQANFREGSASLAEIRGWAFPPRRLLTLAMPDFFGDPSDHEYWDVFSGQEKQFETNYFGEINPHGAHSSDWGIKNYVEGGIYLGVLSLFLTLLGFWSAFRQKPERRSEIFFFFILGLLSLAFIFGTPVYAILYYGLPGINQLHSPFRWVFPLSGSAAILAGYGIDYLLVQSYSRKGATRIKNGLSVTKPLVAIFTLGSRSGLAPFLSWVAFWGGIVLLLGLALSRLFFQDLEPLINRVFLSLEQATDAFANGAIFYSFEVEQIAIFALFLVVTGLVLRASQSDRLNHPRPLWVVLAMAVLALDLFIAGYGFNAAADPSYLNYKPDLIQWLEGQPGLWRLTTFTPHGDKPLNANTPWLYKLQDIRGYDSVILKQYTDYMEAIEPQRELPFNRIQPITNWESLNSPLLDLLGVKYIVSSESIHLPKLQEVWQGESLIIYENLSVVPRAYTLAQQATLSVDNPLAAMGTYDPRLYVIVNKEDLANSFSDSPISSSYEAADIIDYGINEVIVQTNVDEPSWLILNDTYFQGWDAFIREISADDGGENPEEEVEIHRVNGNFRGILLESGSWEARFHYSPTSFKLGGLTSFMGFIIILFAVAVWIWRRIYDPEAPLTNTRSIAKNSLAPMSLNLFNRAIDFVYAAFYLRILGPSDAGKFATAIIIAGWFEIIANWGLNTLIIREVSKDKSQASRYLLNTSILRIATAIIGALPIAAYLIGVSITGRALDPQTTAAILLLMVGMIFSGLGQGLAGLFYAYESAEFPAAVTTITTILKVGFGVAILLTGFSFVGLAAVSIVVNFITLFILTIAAFKQFDLAGPYHVDFNLQRRMFFLSYPLMLNHLFAVIFFQIDVPLMEQINGPEVVGWYNTAYKYVNAINVIPSFFTFALFPVITRQIHSPESDAQRTFRLSLKLMLLISLPIAALTTLLAPFLIGILGGRAFLPHGAIALQIVIWSIPIGWMNSVTNYVLIAYNLERMLTRAFVVGVGFNLIANLIFLPRYSYVAASVLTIFSELLLLVLFAHYLRPALPKFRWVRVIKKPLAVAAAMMTAIVIGNTVNILLAIALGLASLPLSLYVFHVFGEEEKQILRSLLPARLANRLASSGSESTK